jgi:hypothetical protein
MDFVVVTLGPDIKLLRHFLASYELYYTSKNHIYVVTNRANEELVSNIHLPDNTKLVYREDYPELRCTTPYSQQVYLKACSS